MSRVPDPVRPGEQPAETVRRFDAAARRYETPCGDGAMVWRTWGAGTPVILLHGGSGSWTHWIKTIPDLARDYELWVPDIPGLGDSAMPPMPHVPKTCADVLAVGFQKLFAGERPHLVAFSFGSHVGAWLAADLGPQIRSFTVSGCAALGLPHKHLEFAKEHARMTPAEHAEVHRTNLAMLMIADPARIDALAVHLQAENIARARFRSRQFANTAEIARMLPSIPVPMGAIWGDRDVIATPSVQARIDVIRGVHHELVAHVVPDAGHWAAYENAPGFNAALRATLSALEQLDPWR
jgi:2-hydroxy-6-oxonona-2,4-dienedioate hydrolase